MTSLTVPSTDTPSLHLKSSPSGGKAAKGTASRQQALPAQHLPISGALAAQLQKRSQTSCSTALTLPCTTQAQILSLMAGFSPAGVYLSEMFATDQQSQHCSACSAVLLGAAVLLLLGNWRQETR